MLRQQPSSPQRAQGATSPTFSLLTRTGQGSDQCGPHAAPQTRGPCLTGSECPGPPPREKGREVPRAWRRAHPMAPHPVLQIRPLRATVPSARPGESQKSPLQTVRPTSTEVTMAVAISRSPCCGKEKPLCHPARSPAPLRLVPSMELVPG